VLRFSLKGAIATCLFVSAAYIPFFFSPWTTTFTGNVDRVLHLVFSGIVMLFAGLLTKRERRNRTQTERDCYLADIGQVATVIVHDLKNPLIFIQGFARRIQEGKGDPKLAAATIKESAQTMQRIVTDVLDFAKPMQLDLRERDIRDTIRRAGESCRAKAEESGIALVVNLPVYRLEAPTFGGVHRRLTAFLRFIDNSQYDSCVFAVYLNEPIAKLLRASSATLPLTRKLNVHKGTPHSLDCLRLA